MKFLIIIYLILVPFVLGQCDVGLSSGEQCGGVAQCIDYITKEEFTCRNTQGPWQDACCPMGTQCIIKQTGYWTCGQVTNRTPSPLPPIPIIELPGPNREVTKVSTAFYEAHNKYRALHGTPPLVWSYIIEDSARSWASRCVFEHDLGNKKYGENLAAVYDTNTNFIDIHDIVKRWYDEIYVYDFDNPNSNEWTTWHATQVLWRESVYLGCYIETCDNYDFTFIVCRYSPPGNVIGHFGENVMRPI